jgi:glyoxylase-like metal-dependent hydrolase (beta-lactamase superfamily II)
MRHRFLLLSLLLFSASARGGPAEPAALAADPSHVLLERAAAGLGLDELTSRGFLQLTFAGTVDESVYTQGLESSSVQKVQQTFAFDLARDAVGWESRGPRGDGSVRWRRFTHPEPDIRRVVELTERWESAVRSPAYRQERLRTARVLPHLVVREARQRFGTVRPLPPVASSGRTLTGVSFATATGEVLDLHFGGDGLLARIETWLAVPFVGDRKCTWEYTAWRREGGIAIPGRRRVHIGDRVAEDVSLEAVEWSRDGPTLFHVPAGFRQVPERSGPPVLPDAALGQGAAREVAAGIWFAADISPGFHGMFVDHLDGITALEAPAGTWWPLTDVPPANLVRGARSSGVGEAFVDVIRRTLPGRPLRRVVISHPHADHAGGLRAFAAAGAEILVGAGAAPSVERFLAERFVLEPDRFEGARTRLRPTVREIVAKEVLGDGAARLELIPVAGNPHSAAMLAAWFPAPRILFQGDLFYPEPLAEFPSPNRLPIMVWFADWLRRQDIAPDRIYSTHSDVPATREHLEKLSGASKQ